MNESIAARVPDGDRLLGVSVTDEAELDSFLQTAGLDSVAIVHVFTGFMNDADLGRPLDDLAAQGAGDGGTVGMLSWRAFAADTSESFVGAFDPALPGGTSASIARGDVDARLLELAGEMDDWQAPLLVRPNWEMNAPWYPWGAFERDLTPKEGNAPSDYVDAWRRIVILWEGGDREQVDARLDEAGLPPLTAGVAEVPVVDNVEWVWNISAGAAKPFEADHDVADYYPGDAYVDWVGVDWYQHLDETVAEVASERPPETDPLTRVDDLYAEFTEGHAKPFMIGEWGVVNEPRGAGDDPQWVEDLMQWAADRDGVKAAVYFNRDASEANHRLQEFPESAAAFAAEADSGGWLRSVPPPPVGGEAQVETPGVTPGVLLAAAALALVALALIGVGLTRRRRPPGAPRRDGGAGASPDPSRSEP